MKLQKNTQLALYSVLEFAARPGELVPAAEVADKYGESAHHLAKVLSELVRAHIDPEGDIHASADYRRMLAAELTRRALASLTADHDVEGAA